MNDLNPGPGSTRIVPSVRVGEAPLTTYTGRKHCKKCATRKLSIYHPYDVCMSCIVELAQKFDRNIESFAQVMADSMQDLQEKVWRKLKIKRRKKARKADVDAYFD